MRNTWKFLGHTSPSDRTLKRAANKVVSAVIVGFLSVFARRLNIVDSDVFSFLTVPLPHALVGAVKECFATHSADRVHINFRTSICSSPYTWAWANSAPSLPYFKLLMLELSNFSYGGAFVHESARSSRIPETRKRQRAKPAKSKRSSRIPHFGGLCHGLTARRT
jgi:hypothetical protein